MSSGTRAKQAPEDRSFTHRRPDSTPPNRSSSSWQQRVAQDRLTSIERPRATFCRHPTPSSSPSIPTYGIESRIDDAQARPAAKIARLRLAGEVETERGIKILARVRTARLVTRPICKVDMAITIHVCGGGVYCLSSLALCPTFPPNTISSC